MSKKTKGEVQTILIMKGRTNEQIDRFMIRWYGPSKSKDGSYKHTTAWYRSDLRKKGFLIPLARRAKTENKIEKLKQLATKYGIKMTVDE